MRESWLATVPDDMAETASMTLGSVGARVADRGSEVDGAMMRARAATVVAVAVEIAKAETEIEVAVEIAKAETATKTETEIEEETETETGIETAIGIGIGTEIGIGVVAVARDARGVHHAVEVMATISEADRLWVVPLLLPVPWPIW